MRLFSLVAIITALTYASSDGQHGGPSLTPGPAFERLDRGDALLVVIDFQEGFIGIIKDMDTVHYRHHTLATGALAQIYDLPVIISPTTPEAPFGVVPWELITMHPNATIVVRDFRATNAWDSEEFREAVRKSGKSQVIVIGLTTDVCIAVLALSLREEGYGVWVNVEATGTQSVFARDLAIQRMVRAGVNVVATGALMTELGSSGPEDVRQWIDTYNPSIGFIARAHGHAIQDGVIQQGMEELL